MAALATQVRGRTRRLLVAGIAMLLGCALGLDAVQGLFMAAGNENVGFVLAYHVEELGENVAALLLLGAATTATRLRRSDGGVTLSYTGGSVRTSPTRRRAEQPGRTGTRRLDERPLMEASSCGHPRAARWATCAPR